MQLLSPTSKDLGRGSSCLPKVLIMKPPSLSSLALLSISLLCLSTTNSTAQNWQPTSVSGPWSRIACSADGTRLIAVREILPFPCTDGIYASTNSGSAWAAPNTDAGSDVAGSADGTRWIVADGYCGDLLFTYSPASGWLAPTQANVSSSLVASSADGTKLAAAGQYWLGNGIGPYPAGILVSTNSGASWQTNLPNAAVSSLACSASASTIVAATPSNFVYISTNLGATWSTNIVDNQWLGSWNSVACSADGSRLFAASDDGVFVSTNAGLSWTQIHGTNSFQSVAVSADGTQLAAAVKAGLIYTSTNSGVTWDLSGLGDLSYLGNTNTVTTTVAMSADGSRMFAAPQYGAVYIRQSTPPPPLLRIVLSGTNLSLFWPYPSSNFVLQETTHPATKLWQDVLVTPSLNYTTLQNEVAIPAPAQPLFFRLSSFQSLQGTFQDLDFESAATVPVPGDGYGRIQFTPAFPGWIGYSGTNQATLALFNNIFLDSAGIGLQTNYAGSGFDGKYYATIEAGFSLTARPLEAVSSYLSQTGFIPNNARSIQFKANIYNLALVAVTLNGQPLYLWTLTTSQGTFFQGDVTPFSGTTAELRFTVLPIPPPQPAITILRLDSISFSSRPAP
jgi:hypothetical protein